ncbi:hypothetical protein, conserved [Trypanosoma brucei brucei TREU927]|uniref:Uncharacterized protein n=1 Tax=Trypanosoma brucei brucei (strain 927/4 GUTat10.1) TaxID=185431 RepID=Q381J2_TRYB2|nr:hypothetical protein, conserved [Trypanosoma brucei brucei TREU927]EAN80539.1 hypothetical protein, conserved [Trypanosoma brucei brucei TREU927]
MSRPDKRRHRDCVVGTTKDESVRLYAFANTRPGYQVVFSPEQPLIVLKTRKSADKPRQHPCMQWSPLASLLFVQLPNTTHAMYVADTTGLPDSMEREEQVSTTVGPIVKRLANVVAKLNPHNGTMVAAGVSGVLAFKYIFMGEKTLGHTDRLVQRLLLVCPPSIHPFLALFQVMGKRVPERGYPKPEIVVVLSDVSAVNGWNEFLTDFAATSALESWSVSSNVEPSLFAAILREAGISADGTKVALETRHSAPRVYRIDFVLSAVTKRTEQQVTLSPLSSSGCGEEDMGSSPLESDDGEECEDEEEYECGDHERGLGKSEFPPVCRGVGTSEEVFGLMSLPNCKRSTCVVVEGRIMDAAATTLGTTQGRVYVTGMHEVLKCSSSGTSSVHKSIKGVAVRLRSFVKRDEQGRTSLQVTSAVFLTKNQERRSMTVCSMAQVPAYNVSEVAHAYGALLVRGRKCVLVRSLDEEYEGVRLPYLLHTSSEESSMECAERALCEHCDISPDNFYLPSYIPPTCVYEKDADTGITTSRMMYVALAVTPPAEGAGDAVEDEEDFNEPYDWFGYTRALRMLQSCADRKIVQQLQCAVRSAYDVGLYIPLKGLGVFGDDVLGVAGRRTSEVEPASGMRRPLEGLELLVVCSPGDTSGQSMQVAREHLTECVLRVGNETPRCEILQGARETMQAGKTTLVLCLQCDVDVNVFSEEQLTYWSEKGARPRLVTLLFSGVSEMILQGADDGADSASAFIYSIMLSDVLVTAEEDQQKFTSEMWGLLQLAHELNGELMLCAGIVSRRPIETPPIGKEGDGGDQTSYDESSLHEITVTCTGRPVEPSRLARLLEVAGLDECYRHAVVLWVQGEVWIASRPKSRGLLALDISSRCLTLEEGEPWEDDEGDDRAGKGEDKRQNVITVYVWATAAGRDAVRGTINTIWEPVLCTASPLPRGISEGAKVGEVDDGLPPWE